MIKASNNRACHPLTNTYRLGNIDPRNFPSLYVLEVGVMPYPQNENYKYLVSGWHALPQNENYKRLVSGWHALYWLMCGQRFQSSQEVYYYYYWLPCLIKYVAIWSRLNDVSLNFP